jgi:hypothetical protein
MRRCPGRSGSCPLSRCTFIVATTASSAITQQAVYLGDLAPGAAGGSTSPSVNADRYRAGSSVAHDAAPVAFS